MDSIPLNSNTITEVKQQDEGTTVPETPVLVGDEGYMSDEFMEESAHCVDFLKPDGMPATPLLRPVPPSVEYALPMDDDFML